MENILCPFCNGEILADAKKCQHCGEWVNKDVENLPEELKHFNWGAFLLNWIWGIWHKKYITLVYFPCLLNSCNRSFSGFNLVRTCRKQMGLEFQKLGKYRAV